MSSRPEISSLTPLRGLAALGVLVAHYSIFIAPVVPAGAQAVPEKMVLLVDLFFILSGFIISHAYGRDFAGGVDGPRFLRYARTRFARVYPLHIATLAIVVLIAAVYPLLDLRRGPLLDEFYDPTALPTHLVLSQALGIHHEATWNSPSWSISTEWWIYMAFPFVFVALRRTGLWSRAVVLAVVIVGYVSIVRYFQPRFWEQRWDNLGFVGEYERGTLDVVTGPAALLRCGCGFLLGMLLYEVYQRGIAARLLRNGGAALCAVVAVLLAWWRSDVSDLVVIAVWALVILSGAYLVGPLASLLNSGPLRFLGDVSYSIYLVHFPVLLGYAALRSWADEAAPDFGDGYPMSMNAARVGLVLFSVITIAIAAGTYRFIEVPARDRLRARPPSRARASATLAVEDER